MRNVFLRIYGQLDRVPLDLLLLAARIAAAVVFFRSGLTKIASWDTTIALFRDEYALPLIPPERAALRWVSSQRHLAAMINRPHIPRTETAEM